MSDQSTEQETQPSDDDRGSTHDGRRDSDPAELGFASGDLGRIQGILLGDHARRIDARFEEYEAHLGQQVQQIIADLENSNQSLRGEIEVLKAELAEERASRLESVRLATHERAGISSEIDGIKTRSDEEKAHASAALAELRADSVAQVDDLSSRVDGDVARIDEQFEQQGVHRDSLSQILRDAADRIAADEGHADPE